MKKTQQGSIIVRLIVVIVVLVIVFGTYIYIQKSKSTEAPVTPDRAFLISVLPSEAHPGDAITVTGTNLLGHDTLGISSVDSSGHKKFYSSLWEGTAVNGSLITFTLSTTTEKGNYVMYVGVPFTGKQPCDIGPAHCNLMIETTFTNEMNFSVI